jgi:hypothetical protein
LFLQSGWICTASCGETADPVFRLSFGTAPEPIGWRAVI